MARKSRADKGKRQELPTTTIITTVLLLAASAWANGLEYYAAGQMLLIFALISGVTVLIPLVTDDRAIHFIVAFGSMFLAYILLQDTMAAGFSELMDLLFGAMFGAAPTSVYTYTVTVP